MTECNCFIFIPDKLPKYIQTNTTILSINKNFYEFNMNVNGLVDHKKTKTRKIVINSYLIF